MPGGEIVCVNEYQLFCFLTFIFKGNNYAFNRLTCKVCCTYHRVFFSFKCPDALASLNASGTYWTISFSNLENRLTAMATFILQWVDNIVSSWQLSAPKSRNTLNTMASSLPVNFTESVIQNFVKLMRPPLPPPKKSY